MLIGIMTDTHEDMLNIRKAVNLFNRQKVELVLHCGDIVSPHTSKEFSKLQCPMKLVFGNNDLDQKELKEKFKGIGSLHNAGHAFRLLDKNFLMMHEPRNLARLAESQKYDYILYGHTHQQDIQTINRTMVINIGKTSGWLEPGAQIGILDLTNNNIRLIQI